MERPLYRILLLEAACLRVQHHLLLLLYILHYPLSMVPCQLTWLTHQSIKVHPLLIQCNYPHSMVPCRLPNLPNLLNRQSIQGQHQLIRCNYPLRMEPFLPVLLNLLHLQSIRVHRLLKVRSRCVLYVSNVLRCIG